MLNIHLYETWVDINALILARVVKFKGFFLFVQVGKQLNGDGNGEIVIFEALLVHFLPDFVS